MESLLPMLGGAVSGFIFKLIGTMVQAQQTQVELMLRKQEAADVLDLSFSPNKKNVNAFGKKSQIQLKELCHLILRQIKINFVLNC